ncbi:MAG: hypothetical protein AAB865_01360 [Patescibacteria group bacterium]
MPDAVVIVRTAFATLWSDVLLFLPRFLGALIVFLIGCIIASLLRKLVMRIADLLKLDVLAEKLEVKQMFHKAGVNLHVGALLGWIVKWFFVIVFLIAATDIMQWTEVTGFLREVVMYLPNVIIAVIILLVGILVANFTRNVVKSAVEAGKLAGASFLASVSRWAILIFSFMAALVQLQIAEDLIRILFTGLVAMLAIAGGLSFGLGGKEQASGFLARLRKEMTQGE